MYKYYVAYEDDGPSGPCGQMVSVTAPWRKLYVFDDEVKAREFINNTTNNSLKLGRICPKIIDFWSDDPNYNSVVEMK